MKYKALIIEDDVEIAHIISLNLARLKTHATIAYSGDEGLSKALASAYDLIILDLMLPGKSGNELIDDLKSKTEAKIIVVSAKSEVNEKVELLLSGADDYITKPFSKAEFMARVQVQLRNIKTTATPTVFKWKALELNDLKRTAHLNGHVLELTNTEFDLLALLLAQPEIPLTKRQQSEALQGLYIGDDNTINMHISNLRKKLGRYSDEAYIKTVWGIGFMLV
ncbi:response regulator transcription factor [Staphylococcus hyicus]|uniref:response regulator transcription factor n=1 Tax=Staphylococcus hyicus TaxID=1284 RepID=UPI00211B9C11|nr:response regulator transcription factor [Staphylococcus hyicus]MCQ9300681.1 response regulator transcription factor [Staphylococcus hyicus]